MKPSVSDNMLKVEANSHGSDSDGEIERVEDSYRPLGQKTQLKASDTTDVIALDNGIDENDDGTEMWKSDSIPALG